MRLTVLLTWLSLSVFNNVFNLFSLHFCCFTQNMTLFLHPFVTLVNMAHCFSLTSSVFFLLSFSIRTARKCHLSPVSIAFHRKVCRIMFTLVPLFGVHFRSNSMHSTTSRSSWLVCFLATSGTRTEKNVKKKVATFGNHIRCLTFLSFCSSIVARPLQFQIERQIDVWHDQNGTSQRSLFGEQFVA